MNEVKLDGLSKDVLKENISILKEIFPEIVSEDKIDFDKLKLILGEDIEESNERYNFTWPGKTQAIKESQKQSTGTLRPCKEESKNWDTTKNLYIEGDNLEVLKLLQKSYYNKIKMIYIDPPYNTGKDFVYKDNYRDNLENYLELTGQISKGESLSTNTESSGRFHSNWLNMMYPRLKLARNLLTDDGVIFISIDDNEYVNLKKICDELFGEENFICNFIWKSKTGGAGDSSNITVDTEYILSYAKNISEVSLNKNIAQRDFKFKDKFFSERGLFNIRNLDESGIRYSKSLDFEISKKQNKIYINDEYLDIDENFFFNKDIYDDFSIVPGGERNHLKKYTWRWSKSKIINGLKKGYICFKKNNKGNIKLVQKTYEYFNTSDGRKVLEHLIPYRNFIDFTNTSEGTKDLKEIFDNKNFFDYPKPVNLINHFFKVSLNDRDIVMDFFSGSATTAHACFTFNSSENKNISFILIQLEESTSNSNAYNEGLNNICEIGKERIRKSGDMIIKKTNNNKLDIGFKVFKLDYSNLKKWESSYDNLIQSLLLSEENIKVDRTQEDLIYEIMLKYGIDLTLPVEKHELSDNTIYSIGFGALLICLDDNITKDITASIVELSKDSDVKRVVFKDNGFASDSDKTNIKENLRNHNIDEFITI